MLSLSNASGMFDISGTMWMVTLTFVYGLKSIWIPWLWPVFNQIFLMIFLSQWLRRSNVTTGSEWIQTRFGFDKGAKLSNTIVIIFAILSCVSILAYAFIGLGKFVLIFIPWEVVSVFVPFEISPAYVPHFYGLVFTALATFYSVMGGMKSIVWADVVQYVIMTVSGFVIAFLAIDALNTELLIVPKEWINPFFGWELGLDWSEIIPEVNQKIQEDGFSLFSIFFTMMLLKGFLVSMAGPAPNFDMQKILATKSPAEAAKMSGLVSLVLLPPRYLMITGFAVLGLLYYDKLNLMVGDKLDLEQILPSAMLEFVPAGLLGLLLAGLLAAFMSTFAGTLNAAQAYLINDIYLKRRKEVSDSERKTATYTSGILVVVFSVFIGLYISNINSMIQWLVSGLWGGYIASNVLKWYWWRFNGYGYFLGMLAGLIAAIICPLIFTNVVDLYYFPIILVVSLAGSVFGSLYTKPTDEAVLMDFYTKVRPWGFWKPIVEKIRMTNSEIKTNKKFKSDMGKVIIGIVWQTSLTALPIYFVLQHNYGIYISLGIILVTSYALKKLWWDKLEESESL